MRIARNVFALIRGAVLRVRMIMFNKGCRIGKGVRVMSHCVISARKSGRISIGDNVVIESGSHISALNGGEIVIENNVGIGGNSRIISHDSIVIKQGVNIAPNVYIYDHDHKVDYDGFKRREYKTSPILIGENVWIAINSVILRGTTIGNNSVIGASSLIKGNIPNNTIAVCEKKISMRNLKTGDKVL